MTIDNILLGENGEWNYRSRGIAENRNADIVFAFGDTETVKKGETFHLLREKFPHSHIVGCSSSGNILGSSIASSSLVVSAVAFESSRVEVHSVDFYEGADIQHLSSTLVGKLTKEGLKHVFVLSDGVKVNGSRLVLGINDALEGVEVTGGLAGDGDRFKETFVLCNGEARENTIVAIGFYGEKLTISSGCFGGWNEFGVQRVVVRSKDNIVYEIDDEPALDLYKRYLGVYAHQLPNSGLRFPLSIKKEEDDSEVIRTIVGIDEAAKSVIFAGDVPEGYLVKLMKCDIDNLVEGAKKAACEITVANNKPSLALVVSCVGRKLVLGQMAEDELEEVANTLGENANLVGFYSYGEIAPFVVDRLKCELHNQTMTLTAIYEE
jgi:hypothetical protein